LRVDAGSALAKLLSTPKAMSPVVGAFRMRLGARLVPRDALATAGIPAHQAVGLQHLQRYAHLAPDAHGKVLESWARRSGAPVAHGQEGRSS
jgi:hypothetical protein